MNILTKEALAEAVAIIWNWLDRDTGPHSLDSVMNTAIHAALAKLIEQGHAERLQWFNAQPDGSYRIVIKEQPT
jgi:hypothetical protein